MPKKRENEREKKIKKAQNSTQNGYAPTLAIDILVWILCFKTEHLQEFMRDTDELLRCNLNDSPQVMLAKLAAKPQTLILNDDMMGAMMCFFVSLQICKPRNKQT